VRKGRIILTDEEGGDHYLTESGSRVSITNCSDCRTGVDRYGERCESCEGISRVVSVKSPCEDCSGKGKVPAFMTVRCRNCRGSGKLILATEDRVV
jgi:DnaJ-class molecular chaperone